MGQLEDESATMKDSLSAMEEERDNEGLDEHNGLMLNHQEVNKRSGVVDSEKVDIHKELSAEEESFTGAIEELMNNDRYIESLRIQAGKAKELEGKMAEKEASFAKLKEELAKVQAFESEAMELLYEGKKRIHELEEDIENAKESEKKIYLLYVTQTKQFEETKILHEESRREIEKLRAKLDKLDGNSSSDAASQSSLEDDNEHDPEEAFESLKSELQLAKENLAQAQENEKLSSLKAESLGREVSLLKDELKSTCEAEENSKKAMDDLALALKEVIIEASTAKEQLSSTKDELEKSKEEIEILKAKLKNVDEKYKEAKKEADRFNNTSERLRLEAEESLLAWTGKETGFVECIKKVEDERNAAQEENKTLIESLKEAEDMYKKAKDENAKLRDIMKQAINEANVAKEAASIAREENSQLKDSLAKKDEALNFLSQENEHLKQNEAAAFENIREWKRLYCEATGSTVTTPPKETETEDQGQGKKKTKPPSHHEDYKEQKEQPKKPKHHRYYSATCLSIKLPYGGNYYKHKEPAVPPVAAAEEDQKVLKESDEDSDSDNCDPLRGSIFDVAESPGAGTAHHHRKKSSSALTDDEAMNSEEFEHFDATHFDEDTQDSDRNSRKKRALLRRFGDLIMRRNLRKDPVAATPPSATAASAPASAPAPATAPAAPTVE